MSRDYPKGKAYAAPKRVKAFAEGGMVTPGTVDYNDDGRERYRKDYSPTDDGSSAPKTDVRAMAMRLNGGSDATGESADTRTMKNPRGRYTSVRRTGQGKTPGSGKFTPFNSVDDSDD